MGFYGFLGLNGAGKSTSLRIILNLIRADSRLVCFPKLVHRLQKMVDFFFL